MKLAKPLKSGGSPLSILAGSECRRGRMAEQPRRSVDREASRAARSLASSPKRDEPRKKVVDVEGERVTCREASIGARAMGECAPVPPGSVAVARMYGSCINLGGLSASFLEGGSCQLTEGGPVGGQESDPSIVVRDGRAVHMAKDRAERITEHSTQAKALSAPCSRLPRTLFDLTICGSCCKSLRVRSEEPCAGRSEAKMDFRRKPRRGERSESKPHAGICEGAAR